MSSKYKTTAEALGCGWRCALLIILCLVLAGPLHAAEAERILAMDVTATVRSDAWLTVHESIEFIVTGEQVERGIIRVFPTDYDMDNTGRYIRTRFELKSVKIDGTTTTSEVRRVGSNLEIRIGDPDKILAHGRHVFEIEYETLGWIALRAEYDELYWNVTGNDWSFPIDRASFRVILPVGAEIVRETAFTGLLNEHGTNFEIHPGGRITTRTPLGQGEGLTAAVAWPKGYVTPPPPGFWESLPERLKRYRVAVATAFTLLISCYYGTIWYFKGKDPRKRAIIPLFTPPAGIEPGFARFLRQRHYSDEILVADILQLAVNGFLFFQDENAQLQIHPTSKATNPDEMAALSESQRSLTTALFSPDGRERVTVDHSSGKTFFAANAHLKLIYETQGREYFLRNKIYTYFGLLLFLPMLAAIVLTSDINIDLYDVAGPAAVFLILFLSRLKAKRSAILLILLLLCAIGFLFSFDSILLAGLLAGTTIAFGFSLIMPIRTHKGMEVEEQLDGLSLYMNTAERHRLPLVAPPDETPKLFEALLPYAYALDCAETWANSFAKILEGVSYEPEWERRRTWHPYAWNDLERLTFRLSRGIDSASRDFSVKQAAKTSSSSTFKGGSGFGGGGASGRGGGGGGGGGW